MPAASRARVVSVRVFRPRLPMRLAFSHRQAVRRESRPLLVEIALEDGTVGHGEAQPRAYVTGETEASVLQALQGELARWLLGREVDGPASAAASLRGGRAEAMREAMPAAFCAADLALIDAAGRRGGRSAAEALGGVRRLRLPTEGAVVGVMPVSALRLYASRLRSLGPRWVKVKVGDAGDVERLRELRRSLGPRVELVADANGAWTREEAVSRIGELSRFGLAAVEQPLDRRDLDGLAEVGRRTGVTVVADESLCTRANALSLVRAGGPVEWNVRIGKCGGLVGGIELLGLAEAHGVPCHLGVMVGETAILRAAGRLRAACAPGLGRIESDEGALLARDVTRSAPARTPRAWVEPPDGPGLGVDVDPGALGEPCRTVGEPSRGDGELPASA